MSAVSVLSPRSRSSQTHVRCSNITGRTQEVLNILFRAEENGANAGECWWAGCPKCAPYGGSQTARPVK